MMQRIPAEKLKLNQYDDEDVIRSWKWFMSFISEKEWKKRKANIESRMAVEIQISQPFSELLTEGTLLAIKDDIIGWYLYLIDVLVNEPHKYEYFQGARIIPTFKRLGADFDILKNIGGIDTKVKDLIKKRKSEADAFLFEILTAILWTKNGYEVTFINEKNNKKTPDLVARKNGKEWNIECKRQSKTSDYTYRETAKRQKMISCLGKALLEHNVLLDIVFHVELETLPDTFLRDLLEEKLKLAIPGKIVSNNEVDIDLAFVDISMIRNHMANYFVKHHSPMLHKLIGKKPVDNKGFTCGLYANFFRVGEGEVNNLYISDISNAYGVYWDCDAKEALWAKARDIKNQVYKAIQQFNSKDTAVVHIGLETFDGPEVERTRFEKISNTIREIDTTKTGLRWIFCHFFQSYSLHDQDWVFDETVSTITPYVNPKLPISSRLMIVPNDGDIADNLSHWDRPLP